MVGLGGLPIAHDDAEDFEGGSGTDGLQWLGRKGVRGSCVVLVFLTATPLPFLGAPRLPRPLRGPLVAEWGQQSSFTARQDRYYTTLTYISLTLCFQVRHGLNCPS